MIILIMIIEGINKQAFVGEATKSWISDTEASAILLCIADIIVIRPVSRGRPARCMAAFSGNFQSDKVLKSSPNA